MQDWAGWLLMLFSFSIVLMWKHVRSDTKVVRAIWLCIVLHHAMAFFNAYVGHDMIADLPDADTYHANGVVLAALPELEWKFSVDDKTTTYIHLLGFFYHSFGASLIFGEELSVLAFILSCVVLVKLVDLLDLRRFRVGIILFFGLLPSAVFFRSLTLCESWQALFFLSFVYWAIRLKKRPGILVFLSLIMSAFCLAVLHAALIYYTIYLIVFILYWVIYCHKKKVHFVKYVRFLFAVLLIASVIILAQKMGWFVTVGHALEGADTFRQAAVTVPGRTTYGVMLDTSSVLGFVKTIPIIFAQYMFAPFLWRAEIAFDFHLILESMLRFLLLFFAFSSWRRSSGEVRSCYGFLLIAVLGIELMWALGTVNWGTAIRHHVPGYGVIVLLGAPRLILFIRKLQFGIFGRRKVSGELNEQSLHMS
jgi:hypothetical protein